MAALPSAGGRVPQGQVVGGLHEPGPRLGCIGHRAVALPGPSRRPALGVTALVHSTVSEPLVEIGEAAVDGPLVQFREATVDGPRVVVVIGEAAVDGPRVVVVIREVGVGAVLPVEAGDAGVRGPRLQAGAGDALRGLTRAAA